jgi:hypothetical protein
MNPIDWMAQTASLHFWEPKQNVIEVEIITFVLAVQVKSIYKVLHDPD